MDAAKLCSLWPGRILEPIVTFAVPNSATGGGKELGERQRPSSSCLVDVVHDCRASSGAGSRRGQTSPTP